jgi:hypothetical protein
LKEKLLWRFVDSSPGVLHFLTILNSETSPISFVTLKVCN